MGTLKKALPLSPKEMLSIWTVSGNISASGNILLKGIRGLKKSKIEAQGSIYSNC